MMYLKAVVAQIAVIFLVPPASAQAVAHPPVPRDAEHWFPAGSDFYPASAARARAEGTVEYTLTVTLEGRVSACRITASSGNAELDAMTCRVLAKYARFDPAIDDAGRAVVGEWSKKWVWKLPPWQ